MSNKLYISMYHYTRDLKNSRYPEIKGLDYNLFDEQLTFFKNNFNVVTMEDVINSFDGKNKLPNNSLLLTFDDGYIDNYTVALPLLRKYGFQGSFFIPAKTFIENKLLDVNKVHFILASANNRIDELLKDLLIELNTNRTNGNYESNEELYKKYAVCNRFDNEKVVFVKRILQTAIPEDIRNTISSKLFAKYVGIQEEVFARELYMNKNQIKVMKDNGMFIGIHGYDHFWLGNLSYELMIKDIDKALECMDSFIDQNSWVMNYPYGSYNKKLIDYVSNKGCKLGLTTIADVVDVETCNKFIVPRLDCNDFPPKSYAYLEK